MVKAKGGKGRTHKDGEDNGSSKKGDIPEVVGKEFWFRAPYLGDVDKFWHAAREFRVAGKGPPNLLLGAPEAIMRGDEVDPTVVYRFGIEKGEYPFSTVQYKFQTVRMYETWAGEILGDPEFHDLLTTAQVFIAIASSLRTNVSRDKSWVDVMISRWCSITHTFVAAWGEFTPTLEDVCYLMGLNAMGEVNPSLDLTAEQQEILEALLNAKDSFTTIKSGYREGVYVAPSWRDKKNAKNSFSGWMLYWYRDFGPVRKDDLRDEVPGIGFRKVGYLAAFLTLWLSLHVFPSPPEGGIDPGLFKIAAILSTGGSVPLAPLFLGTLYRRLDLIAPAARLSKGRFDISTYVHTGFLGMFFYERFVSCAPSPNEFDVKQTEEYRAARWSGGHTKSGNPQVLKVRGKLAVAIDDESKFVARPYVEKCPGVVPFNVYTEETKTAAMGAGADRRSSLVVNLLTPGAMPFYVGGEFGVVVYNPLRVARQFGLDQGVPAMLASVDGQDAWSRYLKGEWRKNADVSLAVVTLPGTRRVGSCTALWRRFWKDNLRAFIDYVATPPDAESVTVEEVDSKKNPDLCTVSNVNRDTWGYSEFLKDEVLEMVDGFCYMRTRRKEKARKMPFADSPLAQMKKGKSSGGTSAVTKGKVSGGETEVVNQASHDRMGAIFGDEVDGLDVPTDDLNDVEMLPEGPNGSELASNPSRRHGMGKQLRDIPAPSSTEVVMDGEDEESSEGEDNADDLSSEFEESGEESDHEEGRMRMGGDIGDLDGGLLVRPKEVVRPEEIGSSSSQVGGGAGTRAKDPAVISRGLDPFGFAPFGTTSSVGVGGGSDVVPSALGGVGALATPCGSTSEVVKDTTMEEKDGEYMVVRCEDGSVELKKGGESVMVKLEYFDGVEESYRQRVLHILRIHPSTFVGLGDLSSLARKLVLVDFGLYLECLDCINLSAPRVDDLALLHKKLTSVKNNGLEVQWLFDRNDRLLAQVEAANWHGKVEQLRASLGAALGTVAHLEENLKKAKAALACMEENLRKAKAVVAGMKKEEAHYVEKHKAASELATWDFDLSGTAGQGLSG